MLTDQEKRRIEAEESYRQSVRDKSAQSMRANTPIRKVGRWVAFAAAGLAFVAGFSTGYGHIDGGFGAGVLMGLMWAFLPAALGGATYISRVA